MTNACRNAPPDLVQLLLRVARQLGAKAAEALTDAGLTPVRYQVLCVLWREGAVPMGRLVEAMCCHDSNITAVVRRMERDGLVTRRVDPADARVRLIEAAPKAEALRPRFEGKACCGVDLDALLSRADQATLMRLLGKLSDALSRNKTEGCRDE